MSRGKYRTYCALDRERIINCAEDGGDWEALAETLDIKRKTAYSWINSGKILADHRGGKKPRKVNAHQLDWICELIEADNQLTLQQISDKFYEEFNLRMSLSTLHNYLKGQLISLKKYHVEPTTMNNDENKNKRKAYAEKITAAMRQNKQIIWMDETNFNLFCRRSQARSKVGQRAVITRPSSRGQNIHVIGAMNASGILKWSRMRGSFTAAKAKAWVISLMENLPDYMQPQNIVLVIDNAPCHTSLDECETLFPGLTVLRLAPYSPALNPIENIWSKLKSRVKASMRVPEVTPPSVVEQRLCYVENMIDSAILAITPQDCINCTQHIQGMYPLALNKQDMPCGK